MDDYWGRDQLTPFNFYDEQSASFGDYLTSPIIQHELKWPTTRMEVKKEPPAPTTPPKEERPVEGFQVPEISDQHVIWFLVFVIVMLCVSIVYNNNRQMEMINLLLAVNHK